MVKSYGELWGFSATSFPLRKQKTGDSGEKVGLKTLKPEISPEQKRENQSSKLLPDEI